MLIVLLPVATASQQRDTPAASQTGTGRISGVVIAEETPPRPVRRAIVTLGGDISPARSVVTDDEGRFEFGSLQTGRFTLAAKKAAFLPAAYGAARPGRAGTAISLARDQHTSLTITMARGAVVTGVVADRDGQPLSGVLVGALDARTAGGADYVFSTTEFVTTDDRGGYRIYGLMPGDYVIAATPRVTGSGETGAASATLIDTVFAELSRRSGSTVATPGRSSQAYTPITPAPAVGFGPTYFPGTSLFREAARVTLGRSEERGGLDFSISPVRVATVSGVLTGDVQNLAAVQMSLIVDGPRLPSQSGTTPVLSHRPDEQGRFTYRNMSPGRYRLTARANRAQTEPTRTPTSASVGGGGGGSFNSSGGTTAAAGGDFVYAVADIEVFGEDITGVTLALQPGSAFAGRIVVDASGSAPPPDLTKVQVSLSLPSGSYSMSINGTVMGNALSAVRPAPVKNDGTFAIGNIGPATFQLRCTLPADQAKVWRVRSAVADGRDLLDSPLAFEPGVNFAGVTLTLTDRHSELSGTLQTDAGVAVPDYFVIVFPADRTLWREGSRRMQSTRPASDGRFSLADLPAGEYVLAALADVDGTEWQRPELLEGLAALGLKVVVREGEQTTQDLRIAR
jgi:protocatechuate 3,4-dioxygenase beta subunit